MRKQHVIVFFENQDAGGVLQNLAALVDPLAGQVFPLQDADTFRMDPNLRYIVGIHAHVDQTVQARCELRATSFRQSYGRTSLEVPLLAATAEPASPPVHNDLRSRPIVLQPGDLLNCLTDNNPAAATDQFVVLRMADGPIQPVDPTGGYWAPFTTAASAMTPNTWNARALVAREALLPGEYEVLAGRALSTSAIAARLALAQGDNFRPPIGCADARSDLPHVVDLPGQHGVLGRFRHDNLPTLELLVDAADNEVQVVDLFIRKVR